MIMMMLPPLMIVEIAAQLKTPEGVDDDSDEEDNTFSSRISCLVRFGRKHWGNI